LITLLRSPDGALNSGFKVRCGSPKFLLDIIENLGMNFSKPHTLYSIVGRNIIRGLARGLSDLKN